MIFLGRIRPTRTTLSVVVGLLWALSFGAVRDFVWADLREGLIDLRGLSRVTRGLAWLGFALLFAMVAALLLNDLWRALSPLIASLNAPTGRGQFLPVALVPATLFLVAIGWSFLLTGALHSHPAIRLVILVIYLLAAGGWVNNNTAFGLAAAGYDVRSDLQFLALHWALVVGVPLFFVLRWRGQPRPAFEFPLLLFLVAGMLAMAQRRELENEQVLGLSTLEPLLSLNILTLSGLVTPLLFLIGVDIANFTRQASGWTTAAITERLPGAAPKILLLLLLAWRLRDLAREGLARLENNPLNAELLQYAGALGIPAGVALVWWIVAWLRRRGEGDTELTEEEVAESAERWALPVILAFNAVALITYVLSNLSLSIPPTPAGRALQNQIYQVIDFFSDRLTTPWELLVYVLAVAGALWLARRGRHASALYLGIFGVMHLWYQLTNPGRPLSALTWRGPEPVDLWWVLIFALAGLYWLARGQLTTARAARLLFLVLITALLRQTSFIENPFSPFFGFAGIGFIAFGLVWDAMTRGSWANEGTPGLPRVSRIFLYLGYILLTVTVVNWALTAHDLFHTSQFTGNMALNGLDRFGRPMLYAIFAVTLSLPPDHVETPAESESEEASPL
ncbi:MAG TPA: hypothetical protein VER55_16695 [Ardenticatenaceae bacterium]|nr:hypothetical protein [Ardenticatenaceae bacterium]